MLRATTIVRKPAVRPEQVADRVVLAHEARGLSEGTLTTQGGLSLTVALSKAARLDDGDALRLEDGRLVAVSAAEEALLEVGAGSTARLLRLAWQLGGSHCPVEVAEDRLYVPATAAAAELVRGQGGSATPVMRAFRPEKEAHDHSTCGHDHHQHDHGHAAHEQHGHEQHGHEQHGQDHGYDHGHDHGHERHAHPHDHAHHDHSHGQHEHGHSHKHAHSHAHSHGPGCGCGHDH